MTDSARSHELTVEVQNFHMEFGDKTVVDDLSFEVFEGETFGFLGSNGSGKTTTIRALLGIYQPTGGSLLVAGKPYTPESGITLGYLPEERGLYQKEPVLDVMQYFGQLKGMSSATARSWSQEYLERVELADKTKTRLDKLSGGQQQKVQLGVTIMNNPELLILDEPTKGFDPVNRRLLMSIVEEQKTRGSTVIMVTHHMEEVERLCDRILLLKNGKAEAYGALSSVKASYSRNMVSIAFEGTLPEIAGIQVVQQTAGTANIQLQPNQAPHQVLAELIRQGVVVNRFEPQETSLDDIFVDIYGTSAAETSQEDRGRHVA